MEKVIKNLENNVTIFGSARTKEDDKYALLAQKLAYNLSKIIKCNHWWW